MESILQNVLDALSLGSLYAIIALGIALVFSVMGLINFAHGEIIMVGAFTMFLLQDAPALVMLLGAVVAALACALVLERLAFRPVRGASASTLLITSFALSYLIQNVVLLIAGSLSRGIQVPTLFTQSFMIGDLRIAKLDVATVIVTVVVVGALGAFLKRADAGVQMRAASEHFNMARLLGVRANAVIATAFAISGILAGIASILLVARSGTADPGMGLGPALSGFVAVVIGGLGTLPGAALGGYLLGIATVALDALLPPELRPFRDAFIYSAVIFILLARPQGLIPARTQHARV